MVWVTAVLIQILTDIMVLVHMGPVGRRVPHIISRVDIRASIEQEVEDIFEAVACREMERRESVFLFHRRVCPVV